MHTVYCSHFGTLLFQINTVQGLEDEVSHGSEPAQQLAATGEARLASSSLLTLSLPSFLPPSHQLCGLPVLCALVHVRPLSEPGSSAQEALPSLFAEIGTGWTTGTGTW